jgi:predicted PurR-regulated permease PerM
MSNSSVTPATLYRAVLLAFGLVVAGLIFAQLVTLILAILIVVVVSLPLSAAATALSRVGVPRAVGAVLALLLGLAAFGGLIALIVPIFSHEINQFVNSLPTIVDELRHRLGRLTGTSPSNIGTQIQHFVDGYTRHPSRLLGPLASVGESVVGVIAAMIVVLLTAVYTAIHPEPLVTGLVRIVSPSRRPQAEQILSRLADAYLGWLRGLVMGMIVLGGITYIGLQIVGLPFAAFFAVFTAVAMIVPYFGALFSSIPPILFALTISPGKAVIVAVIYIVAHQVESNLIQPLVVARTVKLHPAVVAIGVVAVDQLFGFVGVIVAVPILATIKILIEELWVKPVEHSDRAFTGDLTSSPSHDVVSVAGAPMQRTVGAQKDKVSGRER